ncbi:conserved membrane protein of unknown function [Denitratisoma oestradiolicum]|uniref:Cobalamin ABC transporter n=2 Tax=Denitratisoma oestradiolicum TaxID=311182 RepID=A0A6S6Y790_9PROT|nr:conserved membrane protein of unknown function [Denitratisoma oestradiolicum]
MNSLSCTRDHGIYRARQAAIAAVLISLMVLTRGHHFPLLRNIVPGASWAVFFLAGMYLNAPLALAGFLGLAVGIDYAAIEWGGTRAFCVSPAYIALLPAYASLWLAGRGYRLGWGLERIAPLPLVFCGLLGTLVCDVISSGSFYLYSGRFAYPNWAEYLARSAQHLPRCLVAMGLWLSMAALAHNLLLARRNPAHH